MTSSLSPEELFQSLGEVPVEALRDRLQAEPSLLGAWDEAGRTLLIRAVEEERGDLVELLLELGADPNQGDDHGVTPLHLANDVATAEALLARGADVNAIDRYGLAPVHNATLEDRPELVAWLRHRGAELDVVDARGFSPLRMAREYDLPELVDLLTRLGATG